MTRSGKGRTHRQGRLCHIAGVLNNALGLAFVDVRVKYLYAVPFGIFFQCLQIVESHGLFVEKPNKEFQRVVVFEPGGLIGGYAKGKGMGLGKHVPAIELFEDRCCSLFVDTQFFGSFENWQREILMSQFFRAVDIRIA